ESGPDHTRADAAVRVDGASDVVLSVEPAEVRGVRRKRVEVVVGNGASTPTEVWLDATSDRLRVALGESKVQLQPAETRRVPATVRGRLRLFGPRERHSYEVIASGRAAPRRVQGTFASRAIFGSGAVRVIAVVAVMALWITALIVALPRIA